MDFETLRTERREIRDFVSLHEASVLDFVGDGVKEVDGRTSYEDCSWFRLTTDEAATDDKRRPPHLSTSASCLESLADARTSDSTGLVGDRLKMAQKFSTRALDADPRSWRSEGAADVYCRARTLPAVLAFHSDWSQAQRKNATRLLREIFQVVDVSNPALGGVMEWPLYVGGAGKIQRPDFDDPTTRTSAYPPNAFHTYWALKALEAFTANLPEAAAALTEGFQQQVNTARAWGTNALATQAALISGGARRVDPQQLAYAIALNVTHEEEPLTAGTQRHELVQAALRAFFSAQDDEGGFPQSQPLFHYPAAGNAYCYVYETLTELLRPALPRETGRVYRDLLRVHAQALVRTWHLARRTRVLLTPKAGQVARAPHFGWGSAHQAFRREPEGWATAAVYSYLQALRCLLGHWAAEEAANRVGARVSKYATVAAGRKTLSDRGRTWSTDGPWTLGRRIGSLFLHPRIATDPGSDLRDPDAHLIADNEARSALLFGPPGTGKTTMVQALAGALGWQYVEIQAADFLSEGMDKVPARADEIFASLMELDRCVILFDEIDELIRLRTDEQTDPFGRFLTTSMLPKLAQLWDQRRVLFFANTNHVAKADPAIRRSQRFDAALLVMPPDFSKKRSLLGPGWGDELSEDAVRGALAGSEQGGGDIDSLGVLALLRFDQMAQLSDVPVGDLDALRSRLAGLALDIARNEWVVRDTATAGGDVEAVPVERDDEPQMIQAALKQLYGMLRDYQEQERVDMSRAAFAVVPEKMLTDDLENRADLSDNRRLARVMRHAAVEGPTDEHGEVVLAVGGKNFHDDGLLEFRPIA